MDDATLYIAAHPHQHWTLFAEDLASAIMRPMYPVELIPEDETCAICQNVLSSSPDWGKLRKLSCGHMFHASCITPWFVVQEHCPVCKWVFDGVVIAIPKFGDPVFRQIRDATPEFQQVGGYVPFTDERWSQWWGSRDGETYRLVEDGPTIESRLDSQAILTLIMTELHSI